MRIEAIVILNRCVDYLTISDTGSRNQIGSILGLSKIITICRRRNFWTKKVIKRAECPAFQIDDQESALDPEYPAYHHL